MPKLIKQILLIQVITGEVCAWCNYCIAYRLAKCGVRVNVANSHGSTLVGTAAMPGKRFRRSLSAIAISALFSVSMAGEAAIYSGRFDPVDFSGEFTITVPDACRLVDGWHANDANCAVTLTSASALVISSAPEGPDYNGTLTFAPPEISASSLLYGVYIVNNELDSFDTGLIPVVSGAPTTTDGWWIEFFSGHMPVPCDGYCYGVTYSNDFAIAALVPTTYDPNGPSGVNLYNSNFDGPIADARYTEVTRVPEPGTLPLLGGAFLGGWLLRRRHMRGRPHIGT